MPTLFRPESLNHQQDKTHGKIVLIRPWRFSFYVMVATMIAVTVIAFFYLTPYTQKAKLSGSLVPTQGMMKLTAPQAAVVLKRLKKEGEPVAKGEVLYVLSSERQSVALGATQFDLSRKVSARRESLLADVAQLTALSQQQTNSHHKRLQSLQRESSELEREVLTLQARVALAQEAVNKFRTLHQTQFVAALAVQEKEAMFLEQQSRLQAVERSRLGLLREQEAIQAELADMPLKTAAQRSQIERGVLTVEQELSENEARREWVVQAPEAGVVRTLLAEVGASVSGGQVLANISPENDRLVAQVYAPSRAIGFVTIGQTVLLRYQPFPYQKFGHQLGRVISVTRTALSPAELQAVSGMNSNEPLYRITVALEQQSLLAYGQAQPLHAGMVLEADVQLDTRRLIEWVFEPLAGLRGRLS
jgi:membrane fusion protein